MRFDDRIITVLSMPADRADRRAAQWQQLVDLIAQAPVGENAVIDAALARLRELRADVPLGSRRAVAASLAGLPIAPDLLTLFAEDHPVVAAPLLSGARLEEADWLAVLPRLGPTARSLLRHRRDLPAGVEQALARFGAADLVLESSPEATAAAASLPPEPTPAPPAPAQPESPSGESQIRDLVARIESYRREREAGQAQAPAPSGDAFRWETGPDGVILWVDGAPREPLVGQSIAVIAARGQYGVDGQAAGAFEKRAAFRDARFSVAGEGGSGGDWRISGVPFFDADRGTFLGYRGTARRPRIDEVAHPAEAPAGLFGTTLPPDSLRQLIHELRTPLNAIVGFAEMIEGQYLGPTDAPHRGRAAEIMAQATRLLSAVDDLDTAARIETQRMDVVDAQVDAAALIERLHGSYERAARQRGARIALDLAPGLPLARVESGAAERMIARLLAATVGLAGEGEVIAAQLASGVHEGEPVLQLTLDRPAAIAGIGERDLLDPGYSPDGDWPSAPALGLGFALRLVRNLADTVGGALTIAERRFVLHLPAATTRAGAERDQGRG